MDQKPVTYVITDQRTGKVTELTPVSYEDPMEPGHAKAMPVSVTKDGEGVLLDNGYQHILIKQADLDRGVVVVTTRPFEPVLPRYTGKRCSPCTNCGACSW
jgi:hypothetical protein